MRSRRDLLILLGATAVAPRMALAQSKPPVLIGWLAQYSRESGAHLLAAFKEGLAALGWKEGSVVIEERWTDGQSARFLPLAKELAAKKPALIVASASQVAIAAAKAAPQVPIVMASGGDPVEAGLAKSLARPGGMVTGVTNLSISVTEKYLELLLAAAPKMRRVGFLTDSRIGMRALRLEAARRSVARFAVEARFTEAGSLEEIEPAISRLAKDGVQGLVLIGGFLTERRLIVKLALAKRWPVIANNRETVEDGALLGYGIVQSANFRRAAYFVDRILKGAKPADLPIEQPTQFELVVNLKTAKMLKLEIPRDLAVRADKVIE